jgi:6-phosphogluconolactonase
MTAPSVFVGTYARAGGLGLYRLEDDGPVAPYTAAPDASFGLRDPERDLFYFVEERDPGCVGVHRLTAEGWERLSRIQTFGAEPCHLALSPDRSALAVANYGEGGLSFFALDAGGLPLNPPWLWANAGHGPHAERQKSPHAHWVGFSPDGRWLYQTDLGTDEVLGFPARAGRVDPPRTAFRAPPGSGPRHLALHPARPLAFLVAELASTVTTLEREGGELRPRQTLSTLPGGYGGRSLGGHLGLNAAGDRLYATNRGHDSVAVFAVEPDGLRLLQHVPSGGASPRFFLLLEGERRLLVANEEGNCVASLPMAPDGTLAPPDRLTPVPGPVFLVAS